MGGQGQTGGETLIHTDIQDQGRNSLVVREFVVFSLAREKEALNFFFCGLVICLNVDVDDRDSDVGEVRLMSAMRGG